MCWLFSKQNKRSGFTLIEMIVVIAIFVIITGVILANLPNFQNAANLQLVAQDVSLVVRGAQVYSLGSKAIDLTGTQYPSFGIHFGTLPTNPAHRPPADCLDPKSCFFLYGNASDPETYDDGLDIPVEYYRLPKGFTLNEVIYNDGGTDHKIAPGDLSSLDILFRRPETNAFFYPCGVTCNGPMVTGKVNLVIGVAKLNNSKKCININPSGMIVVQNCL